MALHHQLQDRLAAVVGVTAAHRTQRVATLLRPPHGDAAGYWLQLSIAVLIATVGLAQGSTAVVIGAMLIAPLMQPIVEFGVGLGLGSPLLTFRAVARIGGSLLLALGASAAITRAMPFHELTPELIARTSPTMLDLFVAGACALAAVYTTVRSTGETASAAAGTAIGISLVPPLCTAGWGLGTLNWEVARGAALLFTANFTSIIALTAVSMLALGYGQVDLHELEVGELASEGASERRARQAARAYERLFRGRLAVLLRILLPAAMLGAIYLPLRAALEEVAWQSSARTEVRQAIAPFQDRMVKQSVEFRRRQIRMSIVAIGDRASNKEALDAVSTEIMRRTGTAPLIEATFVADADALERVAARMPSVVTPTPPPPPPPPPGPAFSAALHDLVTARWPAPGGTLLATRIRFTATPTVELIHLGDELGAAARALLAPELSTALGLTVQVTERALPATARAVSADVRADELATWLGGAGELLDAARDLDVVACLEAPALPVVPRGRRAPPPDPARELTVAALVSRAGVGHHELAYTDRWALRFARGACAPPASSPAGPAPPAP